MKSAKVVTARATGSAVGGIRRWDLESARGKRGKDVNLRTRAVGVGKNFEREGREGTRREEKRVGRSRCDDELMGRNRGEEKESVPRLVRHAWGLKGCRWFRKKLATAAGCEGERRDSEEADRVR